jgi:hypothetical protein
MSGSNPALQDSEFSAYDYLIHSRRETMTLEGTIVNGVILLDGGAQLPEGTRVRVEVAEDAELLPPAEPYDRQQELAILRESLEDVRAGRGMPFEEFMAQIATEHNLPPVEPE